MHTLRQTLKQTHQNKYSQNIKKERKGGKWLQWSTDPFVLMTRRPKFEFVWFDDILPGSTLYIEMLGLNKLNHQPKDVWLITSVASFITTAKAHTFKRKYIQWHSTLCPETFTKRPDLLCVCFVLFVVFARVGCVCVCVCFCVWESLRMSAMWVLPVISSLAVSSILVRCHVSIYLFGTFHVYMNKIRIKGCINRLQPVVLIMSEWLITWFDESIMEKVK